MFKNKNILITGGTGSFGKAFVEHVLKNYNVNKIVIFSRDELKQFDFQNYLENKGYNRKKIRFFIGDVRDQKRLSLAFQSMDYVIHAAALKQIPTAEYNPQEVIKTNINGAENVIYAALEQNVKKIIALSTDKAVNPVNLYGATKLVSDKLFIAANNLSGAKDSRFSVVRYGNVINSRGSVIPFFKEIYKKNKSSLPITHIDMTRFFIEVEKGVEFVINSFKRMHGGEIFIPKLFSIKIVDIAKALDSKIKINIVGIRPGEKLHEILCQKDESHLTLEFKDHYIIKPTIGLDIKNNYKISNTGEKGKNVSVNFEYVSSNNTMLKIPQIQNLLKNN
tara:strand:- start:151 stop:1155 length:1005 start_codon:yes stop_codon:yes gene_type:complete